jgi:DNA polymerase III delta prime subunit
MNDLSKLFPENLYHSYIVEADPETACPVLLEYIKERGDIEGGSPDLLYQLYDSFTVGDCVLIKEWHSNRGITGGKRICIIGTKFINHEAEKSLLKLLEEPATNTHFFIVVPNSSVLLDTIRSRAHVVKISSELNLSDNKNAGNFLKKSSTDRIEQISEIIKKNKDNENSGGLRSEAIELINNLEKITHQKLKTDKKNLEILFALEELQKAREYLGTPGASTKMILEHIALVI